MFPYLLIFCGGGLGAMSRYAMASAVTRLVPQTTFPWGTLAVNLLGALLIGGLMELTALKLNVTAPARLFLVTGVLGGFTTFSAFSLETILMLTKGTYGQAAVYVGVSVMGTVALSFMASWLVRHVI